MAATPFVVPGATAFVKQGSIFEKWQWPVAAGNGPVIPVDAPGTLHVFGSIVAVNTPGDPSPNQIRTSFFPINLSVKCPVAGTIVNPDDSALPLAIASTSNDGTFTPTLTLVQVGQAVSFNLAGMGTFATFALWYMHTPIP